jgi:hypothetical protein
VYSFRRMDEVFTKMAEARNPSIPRVSRKSNGFSRSDVVSAFQSAFDVIGGVNRLALWANANPDKFYVLYAKLLPATTQLIGDAGALEIIHRLAPTALDRHEAIEIEATEVDECLPSNSNTNQDDTSVLSTSETTDGPSSSLTAEPEKQWPLSTT